jgi:hypothetical protein
MQSGGCPAFIFKQALMFWHPGIILTFCLNTKKSRYSQGVCWQILGRQFTFWGGTADGLRYRPAPCPLLEFFICYKNALGRLRHSTCPAAKAVGLPVASNDDFANDWAFMGFF